MASEHCLSFLIPISLHLQEISKRNRGTMNHLWCFPLHAKTVLPRYVISMVITVLSTFEITASGQEWGKLNPKEGKRLAKIVALEANTIELLLISRLADSSPSSKQLLLIPCTKGK